ncbi:DsbA family oxidoreductase [Streptomyces tendae]|uniref:DsbA family oxidoreductase n=1 Tax=Streptomyces tendae TaxID=1932 RepID=A0ABX6A0N3_STRTE|nr:DsbA family oxidoreductase [Streptomyces tendae]QER90482.1 DsbA family oxidoreductase [Streptomyces tendae]QER90498.1 DsbA family oxidoreductase [Streptomyces tendae]
MTTDQNTAPTPTPTSTPSAGIDPIRVDVWSDIACPWCYIGKRKFEKALTVTGIPVEIEYHAYELAPDLPEEFEGSEQDYLEIRGFTADQVQPLLSRIVAAAKAVGLDFNYDILRHTNMLKGHQLIRWAKAEGHQLDMVERILAAHFEEGRHVGRDEDLAELAAEIGLDREKALSALREGRYADDVRADEAKARQLGIQSVPFYVFENTYGVAGAQDPAAFADILRQLAEKKQETTQ